MLKKNKVVSVAVEPETRKAIASLAEKSGMKKYFIIREAINLWAKTNGYEV